MAGGEAWQGYLLSECLRNVIINCVTMLAQPALTSLSV